jgi:hypothetical protein
MNRGTTDWDNYFIKENKLLEKLLALFHIPDALMSEGQISLKD